MTQSSTVFHLCGSYPPVDEIVDDLDDCSLLFSLNVEKSLKWAIRHDLWSRLGIIQTFRNDGFAKKLRGSNLAFLYLRETRVSKHRITTTSKR